MTLLALENINIPNPSKNHTTDSVVCFVIVDLLFLRMFGEIWRGLYTGYWQRIPIPIQFPCLGE
jgi:hypothetical protein